MIKESILSFLLFCICLLPSSGWAKGLSTSFADVVIRDVPLGKVVSVDASVGEELRIRNLGDMPVIVRVDVLVPATSELRGGAVPIPNPHWIQAVPDHAEVPAHSDAVYRLILTVPVEKAFRGRTYQATIWSHTEPLPGQGMVLNAGLLSRLRFRTRMSK